MQINVGSFFFHVFLHVGPHPFQAGYVILSAFLPLFVFIELAHLTSVDGFRKIELTTGSGSAKEKLSSEPERLREAP